MTKKHDILPIDGGYVVVDKEANVNGGDWFWRESDEHNLVHGIQKAKSNELVFGHAKIIASISIRIEGVPLIELPDEALRITNMALYKAFPNATKEEEKLYKEIYANGYRTASNIKQYTEADMIGVLDFFLKHKKSKMSQKLVDAGVPDKFHVATEVFKLWKSLQKVPISVELEYELFGVQEGNFDPFRTAIEILKITNPETNTITPINITYHEN